MTKSSSRRMPLRNDLWHSAHTIHERQSEGGVALAASALYQPALVMALGAAFGVSQRGRSECRELVAAAGGAVNNEARKARGCFSATPH